MCEPYWPTNDGNRVVGKTLVIHLPIIASGTDENMKRVELWGRTVFHLLHSNEPHFNVISH